MLYVEQFPRERISIIDIPKQIDPNEEKETELGYGSIINLTPQDQGSWLKQCKRKIFRKKTIYQRLPILKWLPTYTLGDLVADFVAGISVGVTLIPQALAYATVAGLPPQYGLYSAYLGCFVYIFLGSTKPVTIGPTAIMSLLSSGNGTGLGPGASVFLAFTTGCIQLLLGIFQFGALLDFIALPVIAGFTSASAVTIATTQVKSLLGLHIKSDAFIPIWAGVFKQIGETNVADAVLGLLSIVFLLTLKVFSKIKLGKDPENRTTTQKIFNRFFWLLSTSRNAVLILIGALVVSNWPVTDGENPFTITGNVTSGFPDFQPPPFSIVNGNQTYNFMDICQTLGTNIIIVPLIGILESVSIARAFSKGSKIDANQEMLAIGTTNLLGSFLSAYPTTGSFARTTINADSGVRTPMNGLFTGFIALLALSVLTPYLYYIPKTCLAAVIISAVIFMVEVHLVRLIWRSKKLDLIPFVSTFLLGTLVNLQIGILVGVAINLGTLLYFTGKPMVQINQIKGYAHDYVVVTPDRSLVFTAMDTFLRAVRKTMVNHRHPDPKPLVIDFVHVSVVDFCTADGFKLINSELKEQGHLVILTNVSPQVLSVLQGIGSNFLVHQAGSDIEQIFLENEMERKASIQTEDDSSILGERF